LWQKILAESTFYETLERIDEDLAAMVRRAGCRCCGGRLHSARYVRKPRGALEELPSGYQRRLSFCCSVDGCRRRHTPPSVRFLGRRAYLGCVVMVAAVLRHGPSPRRVAELRELFGVDRRTLVRWRRWWTEELHAAELWRRIRGQLAVGLEVSRLPLSLLESMTGKQVERLVSALRLLAPLAGSRCCAW
jgi:hypothetical protein